MSLKISFLNISRFTLNAFQNKIYARTLYSASALGVDGYVRSREKISSQFHDMVDKFKGKMKEFVTTESNSMIFTEDLKHMVHLVENNVEDINLVEKMMIKFCHQNKELRFGSYVFGPVVMRMYYHLNQPKEALKAFKNPEMSGFFDQLISFQILMDLLFKNQLYEEIIEVFELITEKQLQGSKYPKNAVVLLLAACYKLNTSASFDYAKKLWSNLNSVGHYPMRRAGTFAAALAIGQNSPAIALEILTSMKQQSYVTIRNLKVAALADLNRPDDTFPILRSVLETDINMNTKHTFCSEVISKVADSVEKSGKKEFLEEFNRIEKQLQSLGHISSSPLDELLCKEITSPGQGDQQNNQSYFRKNTDFPRKRFNQRPGLRDML